MAKYIHYGMAQFAVDMPVLSPNLAGFTLRQAQGERLSCPLVVSLSNHERTGKMTIERRE